MRKERFDGAFEWAAVALLFATPALHPTLIPVVGAPSHLLWWVHVLPVALVAYRLGRRGAAVAVMASGVAVWVGEALFGRGYGVAADTGTVVALVVALSFTNLLVAAFALYARRVTRRYRVLFDEVRTGVIRTSANGTILRMNAAAAELLRWTPSDSRGPHAFEDLVRIPGVSDVHDLEEACTWTGQVDVQTDGGPRSLHVVMAVIHDVDTGGHQILMADRSMEVLREREYDRQVRLATLGEALAGVAHELNNPLTAILAHADLGVMGPLDPEEVEESFSVIRDQGRRMRDLVRELLGFSRARTDAEEADLGPLVERIVRVQRVTVGKKVRLQTRGETEAAVKASATKVEQIVLNLLSNAAYAVQHGGGSTVTVSVCSRGDFVELEVRDDGPGIASEIADTLFEPFATTKPEGEGTGLGLAISRRLARSWGGELTARSLEPRGTAFTLSLPRRVEAANPSETSAAGDRAEAPKPALGVDSAQKPVYHPAPAWSAPA